MTFETLDLHPTIIKILRKVGYQDMTDIQQEAIPHLLEYKDMLGSAQTGTGKTAAYALPIIDHIMRQPDSGKKRLPKALVLAPTRELALQIKESFDKYTRGLQIRIGVVYGGVAKRNQIMKVKRGLDILIATPGRLIDLYTMRVIKLDMIQHFVLDEADQMLDMGFIDDVKKIEKYLPKARQTMLFSATLSQSILALSKDILKTPVKIEITPQHTPVEAINQSVCFVSHQNKARLLEDVLGHESVTSALIFVRTKVRAEQLTKQLSTQGFKTEALHGDRSQRQRQDALRNFKSNQVDILVATDVAARGLDINALSHVINYDVPESPEAYIHRIGRTARAGAVGHAITFCAKQESHLIKAIQNHIDQKLPVNAEHDYVEKSTGKQKAPQKPKQRSQQRSQQKPQQKYKQKAKSNNADKPFYYKQAKRKRRTYNKVKPA